MDYYAETAGSGGVAVPTNSLEMSFVRPKSARHLPKFRVLKRDSIELPDT